MKWYKANSEVVTFLYTNAKPKAVPKITWFHWHYLLCRVLRPMKLTPPLLHGDTSPRQCCQIEWVKYQADCSIITYTKQAKYIYIYLYIYIYNTLHIHVTLYIHTCKYIYICEREYQKVQILNQEKNYLL